MPAGGSAGFSRVISSYRWQEVVGRKIQDHHQIMINCIVPKGLKYNQSTQTLHPGQDREGGPLPLRGARLGLGSPVWCPAPDLPRPRPHPRPTEPLREERKVKGHLEDQPPHSAHPALCPSSSWPRESPGLGAGQKWDKSYPNGLGPLLSLNILLCGLGIISCGHQARHRGCSSIAVIL